MHRPRWRRYRSSHTRFARHLSLLSTSAWSPTSCGRLDGCRALANKPTLSCQKWSTHALQVVGESSILLSSQTLLAGIKPEYNSPCTPHFDLCLQFTATPTKVRVRQACFPKTFAFPKTVEEVVPSRKRMKSKTKPEEPIKQEIKFVCKAQHWDSAMQSECKTRSRPV